LIIFRLIALEAKLNCLHESLLQHGQLLVLEATLLYLGEDESGMNFLQNVEFLDVEQALRVAVLEVLDICGSQEWVVIGVEEADVEVLTVVELDTPVGLTFGLNFRLKLRRIDCRGVTVRLRADTDLVEDPSSRNSAESVKLPKSGLS
jgi:hypothetical protein